MTDRHIFTTGPLIAAQTLMAVAAAAAIALTATDARLELALWLTGVWVVAAGIYGMTPWRDTTGAMALTAAMTLLSVGVTLNVGFFTYGSGGTAASPVLFNDDASVAWNNALTYLGLADSFSPLSRRGYGLMCAAMMAVGGVNIVVPLVFNVLATLATVIMAGGLAYRCAGSNGEARRRAGLAMAVTASVCYLLGSGCILVKDAMVIAAVTATAYAMAAAVARRLSAGCVAAAAAAVAVLTVIRPNYLPFVAIGVVIVTAGHPNRRRLTVAAAGVTVALTALWIATQLTAHAATAIDTLTSSDASELTFDNPNQTAYLNMRGNYAVQPWYVRLATLPLSMAVQYLIPFPWNFMRDTIYGPTLLYSHIAYPWYAIGGVFMFYIVKAMRHDSAASRRLALWAVAMFAAIAYISAGTISRYFLPFIPAMVPAVVMTACRYGRRRGFRIWCAVYICLMVVVLGVCHHLQMSAQ